MPRYFTRRASVRSDDDDWYPDPIINIPTVCDHEAVDTGLLDQHGDTIMRAPNPCGLGRDDEW